MPAPAPSDDARAAQVAARLAAVRARLDDAARDAGREPGEVRILLATKTMSVPVVRAAVDAGADLLGENRVQEVLAKAPDLPDGVELHLIGHLQSNKVNAALRWVSCVQSVDTMDLARRLSARCVTVDRDVDVMVQVNVSGEASKFGAAPRAAATLAHEVATLPRLRLTGFMTIGARSRDDAVVQSGFARLREVRDDVRSSREPGTASASELSMGMSGDWPLAVAEGATIVRLGTTVFGPRPPA